MEFTEGGEQAFEDGGGGFTVELLINDGLDQRLEGGVLALELEREGAGAAHEIAEFGIHGGEGVAGQCGIVANSAASIDHERQGTTTAASNRGALGTPAQGAGCRVQVRWAGSPRWCRWSWPAGGAPDIAIATGTVTDCLTPCLTPNPAREPECGLKQRLIWPERACGARLWRDLALVERAGVTFS